MNYQEPYTFKIFEKISFRQGEEIDDLYSISIDPEVEIIQESNYIQLRGVLNVSGDYQTIPKKEPLYIVDEAEENVVQQVRALDNGFMTFQYPIPVDITIPAERVRTDDRVEVKVDHFDYELPEPQSLNIQSNIRIEGLIEEESSTPFPDQTEPSDFELKEFPTFHEQQPTSHSTDHETHTTESTYQPTEQQVEASVLDVQRKQTEEESQTEEEHQTEEEKDREFFKKSKSQSLHEFFNKKEMKKEEAAKATEPKDEMVEHHEYDDDDYTKDHDEHKKDVVDHKKDEKISDVEEKLTDEELVDEVTDELKAKKKSKGLSYLSKFFREEESGSSQVKIRFVQENESLETIAEKYKIPSSRLERLNGLEDSRTLEEGDVIYVPHREKNRN